MYVDFSLGLRHLNREEFQRWSIPKTAEETTVILVIGSDEILEIDDRPEIVEAIVVIGTEGTVEIVVTIVATGVSTEAMIAADSHLTGDKKTVRSAVEVTADGRIMAITMDQILSMSENSLVFLEKA